MVCSNTMTRVWGYDYFGGARTVDVHIRWLWAKVGQYESLIGTIQVVRPYVLCGVQKNGAGDRARTGDIQLGRLALYQLSYSRIIGDCAIIA